MMQIKKHDYVKINAIQSLEFGFYFLAGDILVFSFFHPRATLVPLGIFFFFLKENSPPFQLTVCSTGALSLA